jgi:uncharacterized membrane protein YeaQ/YmgE (transglycosylase-associated protein family)
MIGHMLFGLVIGIVAKFLIPGQHPGGIIATMLIGIVGAWLGGLLGRMLGMYPEGHPAGFLMALVGAIVVLLAYGFLTRPSTASVGVSSGNQYVHVVTGTTSAGIMRA